MPIAERQTKSARRRSPPEFKAEALGLAEQVGMADAAKKYKATTDSGYSLPVAPNHLGQDFSAQAPGKKWVRDITYLRTGEGWLYMAVALVLFSRMVVGWAMDKCVKAKLICDALQMALWRRRMPKGGSTRTGAARTAPGSIKPCWPSTS